MGHCVIWCFIIVKYTQQDVRSVNIQQNEVMMANIYANSVLTELKRVSVILGAFAGMLLGHLSFSFYCY